MSAGMALVAVVVGLGSGLVSGMLGVGGGLLTVPAMVLFLGLTQHVAEGTSLLVIIPTAVVGAVTLWRRGLVMLRAAMAIGLGGVAGALAGSRLALTVDGHTLRLVFATYLVIVGVWMIVPARRRVTSGQT